MHRFPPTSALALLLVFAPHPAAAQADRPIPAWLVLGAFPVREGPDRLVHPYLAREGDVAPLPGETAGPRMWVERSTDVRGQLDLKRAIGEPPLEQAVAYAFSWVTSPDERTVSFAFESDDDVRVWLDGTLILEREVARSLRGGTDTVTVRLAPGANRLLMKVVNRTGEFALGARLLAPGTAGEGDGVRLAATRPPGVAVATGPGPALTLGPLAVASSAVLDAATGGLRIPVAVRAARWGGLHGAVRVRVGSRAADLPDAPDGKVVEGQLPTTWRDLVEAGSVPEGVLAAVAGGATYRRAADAGAVLRVLARPMDVEGWRWRDGSGAWHPLPAADAHGIEPSVVREARALGFRAPVPAALAGLDVDLDVAEMAATGSIVRVGGRARSIGGSGRVRLCTPCGAGDTLAVEIDPAGTWWNPPRLIVPDPGWEEISEGARWARYFLGDDAVAEVPGPDLARALLTASAEPDKGRYRALVAEWMERLAPAAQTIRADTIDVVGNAHIDAAWLWRWDETVDVVRNTWRTAVKLLEKYPETTFAGSSAAYYRWLEAYEPDLLERIRGLARDGRWAPVGGWWVEADANLPSGEALVRQALYGQRTYQRLFGSTARVAWIPDTFGYAWTLPQIFRKAGLEYFVTQKLRWNDTDAWTADRNLFWWQGRDGTRILTYVPYGYTHQLQADALAGEWKASRDSTAGRRMLVLYGVGDHGGGPTMEMLDRARALARVPTFPPLRAALPAESLHRMEAGAGEAPVIDDELYLEYHRGVYTSQSAMKSWNRRMEGLLDAAEAAAACASFTAPADAWYNYPRGALTDAWTTTLFNQFHDLLPGSGIAAIYADAANAYQDAERAADMVLDRAAGMIAATLDTRPPVEGGQPFLVLNPSGRDRDGVVAIPWSGGGARVFDGGGRSLPSALRGDTLRARVPPVPATGGRMVFVVADGARDSVRPVPAAPAPAVLDNGSLRVEVDRATGEIARIVDLVTGREVLQTAGGGNRLATREDRPLEWDAWNIDDTDAPWETIADTVWVGGPTRDALGTSLEVLRAAADGRFVQRLELPDGERRLAVETRALWRAEHRLLKASFPLALRFDSVWAEIPYGAIARVAVPRTRSDSARYELPMQGWIDAGDGTWGVGLVNDAKHGYDVRGDTLRLTLLKAPKWPDPAADMGEHVFRYDLVVHDGDWRSGDTEAAARALNAPLRAVAVAAHEGERRARSFVRVEGPGVELGALKVAEDEDGELVLRLVERHGAATTAEVTLPWGFEWRSADLLERPGGDGGWTASGGSRARIALKPWEIATVLVRRR